MFDFDELLRLFRINERFATRVSQAIIPLLMGSLTVAVVDLIHRIMVGWNITYIIWLSLLVSVEAMIASYRLYQMREDRPNSFFYRIVEWIFILLILKFVQSIDFGVHELLQDLLDMRGNLLSIFFNSEFLVGAVILTLIWGLSNAFFEDLRNLTGDEIILEGTRLEAVIRDRVDTRQEIKSKLFVIGAGIIILTALGRIDIRQLSIDPSFVASRMSILNMILFFILALLLLSLTQFSNLRLSWAWDQIPVQQSIAKNWIFYGLVMLFLIGFLALILPTGYAMGFLPTLSYLLSILFNIITYILLILFLPLIFIVSIVQGLIGTKTTTPVNEILRTAPERLIPSNQDYIPINELIKSLLFWSVFIVIIGYVLIQYVRQNRELIARLMSIPAIQWIVQRLLKLRSYMRKGMSVLPIIMDRTFMRLKTLGKKPPFDRRWRFLQVRKLSPRDQVFFWYLTLIRRGREYGLSRKPSQTPYQYAETVSSEISEVKTDMLSITEAFVEARYSQHAVSIENAVFVRHYWQNIRRKFRRIRKG